MKTFDVETYQKNKKILKVKPKIMSIQSGLIMNEKEVIVVVLSNWNIICFDKELNMIWKNDFIFKHQEIEKTEAETPKDVSVLIVPYRVHSSDTGMVIIGMKISNYFNEKKEKNFEKRYHYSYFCFDSKTGALRWKHEKNDFNLKEESREENKEVKDEIKNLKTEMKSNIKHGGEVSWREFRSDFLRNLPHLFRFPKNVQMKIDHFVPEIKRVYRKMKKEQPSFINLGPYFGNVDKEKIPNVLVSYLENEIEVLHLYTGRTISSLGPLQKYKTYIDLNDNNQIDSISSQNCNGKIESGIPSNNEKLFDVQICKIESKLSQFSFNVLEEDDENFSSIKSVAPCIVKKFESITSNKFKKDAIFYAGNGLVTSVSHENGDVFKVNWKVQTPSVFTNNENYAQVISLSLRKSEDFDRFIIVAGDEYLTILDLSGNLQFASKIPSNLIGKILIEDFNGDNINDIIIQTEKGFYGYVVRVHRGLSLISFLTVSLVTILSLMFLSTFINLRDPYFEKSTNYTK